MKEKNISEVVQHPRSRWETWDKKWENLNTYMSERKVTEG